MNDQWEVIRQESKEKREANKRKSREVLKKEGIDFTEHNNGVHLIVEGHIDFWPSTGKFTVRGGKTGRGVFNLVKLCKEK